MEEIKAENKRLNVKVNELEQLLYRNGKYKDV